MWARFLYHHIIGPYLLPSNLTGDAYFIFHEYTMHGLLEDVHQNMWFQHDHTALHFTRSPRSFGSTFWTKVDSSWWLIVHHSLFSIWKDFKRSEKIPGAPTWRWGEWIWLFFLRRIAFFLLYIFVLPLHYVKHIFLEELGFYFTVHFLCHLFSMCTIYILKYSYIDIKK